MRGCLSDIIHFNRTAIRIYDYAAAKSAAGSSTDHERSATANRHTVGSFTFCTFVQLRDLFVSSERYAFEKGDQAELCTCVRALCNAATSIKTTKALTWILMIVTISTTLCYNYLIVYFT